jgi:DNA-directed RNA polymerase I, II, and III subunit RPABC2
MDEFRNETEEFDDVAMEEEVFETPDIAEEEVPLTSAQAAELADLQKLYRQHPEIWIPYEEQVHEKLPTKGLADPNHKTYPILTRYEVTKILSFRASQISNGAKPYILVPEGVTETYQIAKLELQSKRLPYILKRPLPNGQYEFWKLTDLLYIE